MRVMRRWANSGRPRDPLFRAGWILYLGRKLRSAASLGLKYSSAAGEQLLWSPRRAESDGRDCFQPLQRRPRRRLGELRRAVYEIIHFYFINYSGCLLSARSLMAAKQTYCLAKR